MTLRFTSAYHDTTLALSAHACNAVSLIICLCPGQAVRYCQRVEALLRSHSRPVLHVCGTSPHKRANAALLACCYAVMCRGASAEEAFQPFLGT